jgi:hypothetical protein
MKNIPTFDEFLNESELNEARFVKADKIAAKAELEAFMKSQPESNKRSALLKLAMKKGSETIDQDTKFTYSPDGKLFAVYRYGDQKAVDAFLYDGDGDGDKAKEKLEKATYYYETSRPGYRIQYQNGNWTIAKINNEGYPGNTDKLDV